MAVSQKTRFFVFDPLLPVEGMDDCFSVDFVGKVSFLSKVTCAFELSLVITVIIFNRVRMLFNHFPEIPSSSSKTGDDRLT